MSKIKVKYKNIPIVFTSSTVEIERMNVSPDNLIAEVRKDLYQVKFPRNVKQLPTVDGIIKLSVYRQPKFYGLTGDTYLLRDLLPRNDSYGKEKSPLFNKKWGYMYFKNPENLKELYRLFSAAKAANRKYRGYVIATKGPQDKKWGILGWDVKYKDPQWVTDITGTDWRPRSNPEMLKDGTWIFRKCSFSTVAANKALVKVRKAEKNGEKVWQSVYPKTLEYKKGRLTNSQDWHQFVEKSIYRVALAGWAGHARYIYKDDKNKDFYFYDPWMQSLGRSPALRTVKDEFPEWTVKFENRLKEQGMGEGSCAVVAFIRTILSGEYGKAGVTMKIPPSYAVLGSRILSIVR